MWSLTVKASAPHWIEWLPHNAPLSPKLWCRHSGKSAGWEPHILISSVSFNHRPFAYPKPQNKGSTSQIKCIKQKVQRKAVFKSKIPCVSPSQCTRRWPISDAQVRSSQIVFSVMGAISRCLWLHVVQEWREKCKQQPASARCWHAV